MPSTEIWQNRAQPIYWMVSHCEDNVPWTLEILKSTFFFPLFEWHLFIEINAFAVTCSARWWYQQLRLVISFNFSPWHFRWDEKKLSNFRRIYWNVFVGCQHPKNRLLLMMMTTSSCSLSPLEFFVWICQRDV